MKRFVVAILAVLFITSSVGASVQMHYCMGKLADWSVGYQQPDACAGCGMKTSGREKSDCCKNEQQYVKSATDQQLSSSGFQLIPNIGALLLPVFTELSVASIASLPEVNAVNHAPPRTSSVAVYILHCNYRI